MITCDCGADAVWDDGNSNIVCSRTEHTIARIEYYDECPGTYLRTMCKEIDSRGWTRPQARTLTAWLNQYETPDDVRRTLVAVLEQYGYSGNVIDEFERHPSTTQKSVMNILAEVVDVHPWREQ